MGEIKIALIESYYGGSHKYWADNLIEGLPYDVSLFSLPARHWKWRMQGSAPVFAKEILDHPETFEIFIVSDMIDLSFFKALISNRYSNTPCIYYMHENQLTYPLAEADKEKHFDLSYGYMNYKSCLASDLVIFNSQYHRKVFIDACRSILLKMPELKNIETLKTIFNKSKIIPVGIDILRLDQLIQTENKEKHFPPSILWNHRWDEDKNPKYFLDLLKLLDRSNIKFSLLLTEQNRSSNQYLNYIKKYFNNRIISCRYINSYEDYISTISKCSLMPVSPGHDFFGISVLEAIYMGVTPLLPVGYVYEEHFNIEKNRSVFYSNKEEYFNKSISILEDKLTIDHLDLKKSINRYNVENLMLDYIRCIKSLL